MKTANIIYVNALSFLMTGIRITLFIFYFTLLQYFRPYELSRT